MGQAFLLMEEGFLLVEQVFLLVEQALMELAYLVELVPLAELTGLVLAEAVFPHRAALVLLEEV